MPERARGRRKAWTLFKLASASTFVNTSAMFSGTRQVIDSAIHLWSCGAEPYQWAVPPPTNLHGAATAEAYIESARAAGVAGALVVQPANHMYDHTYVSDMLKEHSGFFRGMGLANPTLPPQLAVAELDRLQALGFVGVRLTPAPSTAASIPTWPRCCTSARASSACRSASWHLKA